MIQSIRGDLIKDDFEYIFEPIGIKIIAVICWIVFNVFTNAFLGFIIMFEKFGGDPLKVPFSRPQLS